jgi:hypothetical protein
MSNDGLHSEKIVMGKGERLNSDPSGHKVQLEGLSAIDKTHRRLKVLTRLFFLVLHSC